MAAATFWDGLQNEGNELAAIKVDEVVVNDTSLNVIVINLPILVILYPNVVPDTYAPDKFRVPEASS